MDIQKIENIANTLNIEKTKVNQLISKLISTSFWELLNQFEKIQIPIIQRDYVQGREDDETEKVRNRFLNKLINTIDKNETLELDFVYGNLYNHIFQPLDGQQRLTTLWLLHWYIALKTNNLFDKNKQQFSKFTYETRVSSREFCLALVENGNTLDKENITEKIKDASWFFSAWKKDPTIKAMLVMLGSIKKKLQNKDLKKYWENLVSDNSPIVFHFKQLNGVGLTDDLYIKMNARGKALTPFENFKAIFEKYITDNKFEENIKNPTEKFSHKIDTVWTDLFWEYKNENNTIDNEMMRFIAGVAINCYAEYEEIYEDEEEYKAILAEFTKENLSQERITRIRIEKRIQRLFNNPNEVFPKDFKNQEEFNTLVKYFEIYKKNRTLVPNDLLFWNNEITNEKSAFISLIKDEKFTYKQRVLFYAQTKYLLNNKNEIDETQYNDWMRVVRNIVENTTIDSANFIGAITLIKEISKGCNDIYTYLTENNIDSTFSKKQMEEEKLKAELINRTNENWKSQLFKIEDNTFLKARIEFLIDFSKINESYNLENFTLISNNFLVVFDKRDDLLRRGLLTQSAYYIWDGWTSSLGQHRYSLLHNDNEWKNAIEKKHEKLIEAIKKIIFRARINNREKYLNKLINEYGIDDNNENKHIQFIIKQNNILNNCHHKRFCLNKEKNILYLLSKTKVVNDNYVKHDIK